MGTLREIEPEMIPIPAGEFLMGSDPKKDTYAKDRERPQHTLYLSNYFLAKTPVTNKQYAAFVRAVGYKAPEGWRDIAPPEQKLDHPVTMVSWYDALAYCRWLKEMTGKPYRLPSEAEWEKGARGPKGSVYPWGDRWKVGHCNSKESGLDDTTPVGAYPQGVNPYGLLDMAGNVWEWTISLWGKDLKESAFVYPYQPGNGREDLRAGGDIQRVLRGGAFYYNKVYARAGHRVRSYPDYSVRSRGFRLCLAGGRV